MVHFVIEAVEGMSLPTLKINHRGSGSAQYPPKMMLELPVYCYANGIFSSRRIERATYRDIAVRFLSGDTHPDHDTKGSSLVGDARETEDRGGPKVVRQTQTGGRSGVRNHQKRHGSPSVSASRAGAGQR